MAKIIFIVELEPHDPIMHFAQSELQHYLGRMLLASDAICITLRQAVAPLRYDGYRIACGKDTVCIESCCSRGVLHGSYELLRALGCNFIFPGHGREQVPQLAELPELELCREPWLEYRGICLYNTTAQTLPQTLDAVDWMAKNGYNLLLTSIHRNDDTGQGDHAIMWDEIGEQVLPELQRRGIEIDMSEHSTDYYFPREQLFSTHPEWFSLINGVRTPLQICYSNHEAVQAYADSMAQFVREKAWFRFFGIWPLDGGDYCQCDLCKDQLTIYRATCYIAETIAAVRPDLTVEHLAYTPQSFARPNEPAPANMSVLVCSERGHIAREWAQATHGGGGAFYFDYNTGDHYRWRSNPWINPSYIQQTINAMAAYGYRGIISLYLPVTSWWQSSINYWFMRELYYDPTASLQLLCDRIAQQLFGEAASTLSTVLWQVVNELQNPVLWNGFPHGGDWFCEQMAGRNRPLDELHKDSIAQLIKMLYSKLDATEQPSDPQHCENVGLLRDYLTMQQAYYNSVELYDADHDTPECAEPYFALMKELAQAGKPFASESYARWRIVGRDNIFATGKDANTFAARTE